MRRAFGWHLAAVAGLTLGVVTGVYGWAAREPFATRDVLLDRLRSATVAYARVGAERPGCNEHREILDTSNLTGLFVGLPADARFTRITRSHGSLAGFVAVLSNTPVAGDVSISFECGVRNGQLVSPLHVIVGPDRVDVLTVRYDESDWFRLTGVPPETVVGLYAALTAEAAKP